MSYASVVVLQPDARMSQLLTSALRPHFDSVFVASSLSEFRDTLSSRRPKVAVLELENSVFEDVRRLHREFPSLSIVCTHRLPDDEMWTRVLDAGATDVCPTYDPVAVARSVLRSAEDSSAAA